jgi:hypothetical protein
VHIISDCHPETSAAARTHNKTMGDAGSENVRQEVHCGTRDDAVSFGSQRLQSLCVEGQTVVED